MLGSFFTEDSAVPLEGPIVECCLCK